MSRIQERGEQAADYGRDGAEVAAEYGGGILGWLWQLSVGAVMWLWSLTAMVLGATLGLLFDALAYAPKYLGHGVTWVEDRLTGVGKQASGFGSNIDRTAGDATPNNLLPPSVVSTVEFFLMIIPNSLGITGEPSDQVYASIVLGVLSILSSVLTFGLTVGAVVFFTFTFLVGVLRHVPIVEREYSEVRRMSEIQKFWFAMEDLLWRW